MTRRVRDLNMLVEDVLVRRGKHLMSIAEQIDTNTPMGRAVLTILSAIAQLEREQIAEEVTSRGIPTKKGNDKRLHTSVRRILTRPPPRRGVGALLVRPA